VGALLAAASPAAAQTSPRAEDVATLDGVIKAYYEVVSGPAGQPRDWARDRSLHPPQAQVVIVGDGPDGRLVANVMTLAEYHERNAGLGGARGFFEREIHRVTETHGAVTHVWSTYEWETTEDGPVGGRGVNSIHLVYDGERWWITSWMFDGRNDAPPVPAEYLPPDAR
jgi:hypothetical protein